MEAKLAELRGLFEEITDLDAVQSVLVWDQNTYMPTGGGAARGRQSGLVARLHQEKLIAPRIGELLDDLEPWADDLDYDSDGAALIRIARRHYDRAVRVPPEFTARFYTHSAATFDKWREARAADDFAIVASHLAGTVELSREFSDYFPHDHVADPHIDVYDHGMTVATIRPLFAALRAELVPLVAAITDLPPPDDSFLRRHYPHDRQIAFGARIIEQFGYDFARGRQDLAPHPFMIRFGGDDVRITTRVDENDLSEALFGTMHECGHALYELGIDPALDGSPLGGGTSSGVHESQSRLWENQVGRSRGFWEHWYPQLVATFPEQLSDVTLEAFYRAINKVERGLIRVAADEVTYNLHVMIRFDLEAALLEGSLEVADLPEAWHERYASDLGVRAPSDADGVMQDIHWFYSSVGGKFQGYTLGNILSAALFARAGADVPGLERGIADGEYTALREWLRENVHRHGSKVTAAELVERATGGPLEIGPYLDYLRAKYGELYDL